MKPHSSHMIYASIGMAVLVGIGAVIFALTPAPQVTLAQVPGTASAVASAAGAPAPAGESPDAATPAAASPAAASPTASIPSAPAPVAHADVASKASAAPAKPAAVEPKVAGAQHVARDNATADRATRSEARVTHAVEPVSQPAAESAAPAVVAAAAARPTAGDEPTMPAATIHVAADTVEPTASMASAASDSRITGEVKSRFAADSSVQAVNVGVITTHGVVVLTGTLATQDAIEHVKDVAGTVKDVKSVDTSALKITST